MLIPLDGSELAEQILDPATAIAAATNAEATLLRVVQQFTPDSYVPDSGRVSGLRPALLRNFRTSTARNGRAPRTISTNSPSD